jgi:hypothetical protein
VVNEIFGFHKLSENQDEPISIKNYELTREEMRLFGEL